MIKVEELNGVGCCGGYGGYSPYPMRTTVSQNPTQNQGTNKA